MTTVRLINNGGVARVEIQHDENVLSLDGAFQPEAEHIKFWPFGQTYGELPNDLLSGEPMKYNDLPRHSQLAVRCWFRRVCLAYGNSNFEPLYAMFPDLRNLG
jgi:hypothetical protein